MKEALVLPGPRTKIVNKPIPEPNDDQVLIKVVVSGSNPKDWKIPEWAAVAGGAISFAKDGFNQGDDIAGIVEKVGANVTEFKPGDRVAAFHEMLTPSGSYAEYAIAWNHTTFHLPHKVSFEEAATIPLAALTAVVSLYGHLQLPMPWAPAQKPIPLVVYGGSTAVGSFAIKLARSSNIHPIITVAGKGTHYVEGLIDRKKGDAIIDYRGGVDATVQGIKNALKSAGHSQVMYAVDAVTLSDSTEVLRRAVAPGGHINGVLPNKFNVAPVEKSVTSVGVVHKSVESGGMDELGFIFSRYFTRALQNGTFSGHPFEVRPGGLDGVEGALRDLKEGKASATKYVFRIAETPAVASI